MPLRRGFGGVSSGAGGNLFDRPGFFDYSEIVNLTVDTKLLLKAANETYGIAITHASTANNAAEYNIEIPDVQANDEFMLAGLAQTLTNKTLASPKITTGIYDANGNELLLVTATSSAVNELTLANAATGNPPILSATGGDTNIGITLTPKGSGVVRITGGLTVDGTTTTLNSTTLTIDDKNLELGSVATPSDTTADGGGLTLKGATDKTIIWDNANNQWTSSEHWNIASGKAFYVNNAMTLNATTLGTNVAGSSLTAVGTLGTGAISSGFGNVDIGTSVLTAGQLNIDNIRIDGNTISSTSGQILFDATTTLDFGDDSVLNIGTLTIDAIHGDNNAIQVGDNSDDAVSIYRVNALTAIANLDIGANDFRAGTITADGLTSGRVVFAGTNGVLSDDSDLTFATATLTATNIAAFNLTGKLTAGSTEIEGSAFDINGGTIDGVAIGASTAVTEISVDNLTLNGNTISTTDTNGSMVLAPHGTGDVHLNTDTVQIGDINTLALITTNGTGSIKLNTNAGTNTGHIQINSGANAAIDLTPDGTGVVNISKVNIDAGTIDGTALGTSVAVNINGATIGGGLTWSAAQNLNNQNLTNVDIDSGTINDITTFGIKQDATSYEMQIAVGATTLTADRVLAIDPKNAARTITLTGNLTLAGDFITSGAYATTLTTTGTTGVTLPTTGTLATLAGNETLTNKALTQPAIGNFTSATHTHANAAGGGTIPSSSLSSDVALGSQTSGNYVGTITGGTGIDSSAATSGEGTTHTLSVDLNEVSEVTIASGDYIPFMDATDSYATKKEVVGDIASLFAGTGLSANNSVIGVDASQTQITAVGALNAGSITSGFGNIDIGSSTFTTTGAVSVGNLTVTGSTTYVNSTELTVVDPIINLQTASGGGAIASDTNKDVGLALHYHTGSAAKIAFLGYDDSDGKLMYISDATISSEVIQNPTALGTIKANLEGAVTGNADTATEATNVTAVANNTENETVYLTFVDGATGTQGVETDTGLTYNPYTGVVTAGSFAGVVTGTAETATALANARTIGMTGDVVWTSASFDGTANVTGASTIQANAVQSAMVHQDVVGDRTELTSGIATDADFLLLWDATDSVLKKVKPDNLGVSGLAAGGSHQLQYASGTAFAGAANVQIKNAALALKEMSTPNAESGYGLIYAKSDNELYYRNDTNAEVKLTLAGAMAGGGAFRGIKAYLTANNTIGTGSSVTPTAWTESYDVGGFHVASGGTENRFTFGVIGYYEIKIQQEWAADAAGYREMSVERVDVSASTHDGVILRDRVDGSSQANVSGSSTMVYIDDAADYVKVNLYQNSGADLVATGNNDDSTAITISRIDMATGISLSDGASGRIQLADGSGNFTSDSDLTFATDTLTATKLLSTQVGFNKAIVAGAQVAIQNSNDSTLWPLSIYNDNGNQGFYITQDASGNQMIRMKDNAGTVQVQLDTSGTSYINGNVGIGGTPTTLSDTNLSVIGAATAETHIQTTGTDSLAILRLQNDASTWSMSVRGNDYDKFRIRNDSTSPYDFFTIDEAGFVGIGLNSPMSKAHIYEDTSTVVAGAGLTIEQDGAGDAVLQFLLTGTRRFVVGIDNTDDKFKIGEGLDVGNNTFLTIDGSGNVGIGTATPGTDFAVTSGGDYTGTYDKTLEIAAGGNASSRAFLLLQGKTDSSIIFGNSTNDANDRKAGIVYTGGNLTFGKVEDADKAIDAANVAMSIDTSTGKVGIGVTPSGDNNLEVYKASGANAQARIHAQGNAAILILDSDVGGVSGSVGDSHIQFRNNNSTLFSVGVDDSDDDKFKISTSAIGTNDRFIIDSSGNITMTENLALTDGELTVTNSSGQDNTINAVSGASGRHAWFRSANNANTVNLKMGATRTSNEGNIPANVALILASGSANPDLYFMTNNTPQQAMIIKGSSGGHVGIGVSPTTKFHVNGAVASDANLAYFFNSDMGDASHTSIWIGKAKSDDQSMGIGYYYDTTTADSYAWFGLRHGDTPGTHTINVKSGGYVGIGISPSERLHVNGNFIASGSGTLGSATITPGSTTATHSLRVNANDDAIRFSVSPSRSIARATDHAGVSIGGDGISVTGDAGGTATNWTHVEIGALNYLPANATQTITNAATLKIVGPPTASGGGVTFTNGALALWVDAGNSRFDGNITLQGPSHTSLIINAAASSNADLLYQIGGSRVWNAGCTTANLRYTISDADGADGVYLSQGAEAWTGFTSDERKKTNWIPFTNALDKLATLTKLGTYQRKNPTTNELKSEIRHVGVSAQEIKEILPEAVDETLDPNDGETYLSLRYQDVFVLMLKAIQELKAEIDILKAA